MTDLFVVIKDGFDGDDHDKWLGKTVVCYVVAKPPELWG